MSDQPWVSERYHTALETEFSRFLSAVIDADPATPVPTCPGWTLSDLAGHLGVLYRWVDHLVRENVQERLWAHQLDIAAPESDLAEWANDGLEQLVKTLRAADPDTTMWSWGADQHVRFWSRRMHYETVIHRSDAELALGRAPEIDPATGVDGIDEFLTNLGQARWVTRNLRELSDAAGETVHLHATDGSSGEWMVTITPEGFGWERGHGKGTVAVRATAGDLLLMTYGRIPPAGDAFTVFGDADLLSRWLEKSAL